MEPLNPLPDQVVALYCDYADTHKEGSKAFLCAFVPSLFTNGFNLQTGELKPDLDKPLVAVMSHRIRKRGEVRDTLFTAREAGEIGHSETDGRISLTGVIASGKCTGTTVANKRSFAIDDGQIVGRVWIGVDVSYLTLNHLIPGRFSHEVERIELDKWRLRLTCSRCRRQYQLNQSQALNAYRTALSHGLEEVPVRLTGATAF